MLDKIMQKDLGGTATVKELNRKTEQLMGLSEEICRAMHSAASKLTEVEYRLTWTRNYLKKAGIIVSPKPHVWSFAENFDTNKIDKTDVFEIKRQVRKERFKALESPELTNLESDKAFEKFALSVLFKYAKNQNKDLVSV